MVSFDPSKGRQIIELERTWVDPFFQHGVFGVVSRYPFIRSPKAMNRELWECHYAVIWPNVPSFFG